MCPSATVTAWRVLRVSAAVKPLRSLRRFAEEEIVLPSGPHEGQRFRISRHPVMGLLLDEIAHWRRYAVTGPVQDGKTLCSLVIPAMYHLFEIGENVILGLPNEDMAKDKWEDDFLPAIEASRYKDLLPQKGAGSRGGKVKLIRFRNGRWLRFMSGGGRDKAKAGKTVRVALMTEVDGMDKPIGGSKESDPVRQIEARTEAFGDQSRCGMECTVSTEAGRIWNEYNGGTASAIEVPCPHCQTWIRWEREHLVGWQDATNEIEAGEKARMACPSCGATCDEEQRLAAIRLARLVHTKTAAQTYTLGFRWNAALSPLKSMAKIGRHEWTAAQTDDEQAHKSLNQFTWVKPAKPEKVSLSETDWSKLAARQGAENEGRGKVPADVVFLTAAMDLQQDSGYWSLEGWYADGSSRVVDYGVIDVPARDLGRARAIEVAVKDFCDRLVYPDIDGRSCIRAIVDAGNWQDDVVAACRTYWPRVMPAKGFGESQVKADRDLAQIGYEPRRLENGDALLELVADFWKGKVADAMQIPVGKPGALTLFHAGKPGPGNPGGLKVHMSFVKHLSAERQVSEYVPGKGNRTRFELVAQHRPNHWLDSTAMNYAAYRIAMDFPERGGDGATKRRSDEGPGGPPGQPGAGGAGWVNGWKGRF